MKKLIIKDFEIDEDLKNNVSININIENKEKLRNILKEFSAEQSDSIIIIDDDNKIYNNNEYIEVITSFLNLEINSKKNVQILNKNIKNLYSNEISEEIEKLDKIFQNILKKISMDYILNISSDSTITLDDVLKILNLSINETNMNDIEKLIVYIKSKCIFCNIRIIVVLNISFFFSNKEIEFILDEIRKLGVIFINIETNYNNDFKNIFDKNIIVDKDLFLLK